MTIAANVLVTEDGSVKLGDFGVAAVLQEQKDKRSTVLGTLNYMAPEIYTKRDVKYGKDVDIWAYGCTLYEMATGLPPNSNLRSEQALASHFSKGHAPRLEGGNWSSGLRELIATCLEEKPEDRPPIETVQKHKYIFNTQRRFPTSILKTLIVDYKVWEKTGGKRQSLFSRAGAQQSEFVDDKHFSQVWNFDDDTTFDLSGNQFGPSLVAYNQQYRQSVENHHLLELFSKGNQRTGQSDLAFRNQDFYESSPRNSEIDLGEYDSETGAITIPDFGTIKPNSSQKSNDKFFESDDESEKQESKADLTAKPGVFKFPMAPPEKPAAAVTSVSTKAPLQSGSTKTQPFVFPAPAQSASASRSQSPEPRTLTRANTTAATITRTVADILVTETASAPSSPPRSARENEDALRPSTSSSDAPFENGNRSSFHKQSRSGPPQLVSSTVRVPAELGADAMPSSSRKLEIKADMAIPPIIQSAREHSRTSTRSRSDARSTSSDSAGLGPSRSPMHSLSRIGFHQSSGSSAPLALRNRHIPQISSDFSTTSETDEERHHDYYEQYDESNSYVPADDPDNRALILPILSPPMPGVLDSDAPLELIEKEVGRMLRDFVDTLEAFRVGMDRWDRGFKSNNFKGSSPSRDEDVTPVAMAKRSHSNGGDTTGVSGTAGT
jgi:hypothetical protein